MPIKITSDSPRKIEPRWHLVPAVAASAAIGAGLASRIRRRRQHEARHREQAVDVKTWENEGGNLAPLPTTSSRP